jgi:transcriptional regulator with XRE-family HTH domain
MDTKQGPDVLLGTVVSAAIEAAGLSQNRVAEETGIPLATLNRNLRGLYPFKYAHLHQVAELLGIPVSVLAAAAEDRAS